MSDSDLLDLYRELVLEHSRNPRHFGRLEQATHVADGINPLCGDKLRLYLRVGADGRIEASSFEGTGCAVSVASASLLTATVGGLPVTAAGDCYEAITARLSGHGSDSIPGLDNDNLQALDGVREFPARVKCATLAWQTLHAALNNDATAATTE